MVMAAALAAVYHDADMRAGALPLLSWEIIYSCTIPIVSLVAAWTTLVMISHRDGVVGPTSRQITARLVARGPTVVGCGLLSLVAIQTAALFLIIPGLYLMLSWIITVPIVVMEQPDLKRAFNRSRELTRGFILDILILMGVICLISWSINFASSRILIAGDLNPFDGPYRIYRYFVSPVESAIVQIAFASLVASLYVELATLKEAANRSTVAEAFA
jgi:hypothetical protein